MPIRKSDLVAQGNESIVEKNEQGEVDASLIPDRFLVKVNNQGEQKSSVELKATDITLSITNHDTVGDMLAYVDENLNVFS